MGMGWPGRRAGSFAEMKFRLVLYAKRAETRGRREPAHALLCIFSPLTELARLDAITWRRASPFTGLAHFYVIATDILCGIHHGSELARLPSQPVYQASSPHIIRP